MVIDSSTPAVGSQGSSLLQYPRIFISIYRTMEIGAASIHCIPSSVTCPEVGYKRGQCWLVVAT